MRLRPLTILLDRGRNGLPLQIVAGIAALTGGFVVAVLFFFPVAPLKSWIEAEAASRHRLELKMAKLRVAFPVALVAEGVVLGKDGTTYLTLDEARLAPSWSSLLTGRVAVAFAARTGEGHIAGTATRDGLFSVTIDDFPLTVPLPRPAGASLVATVRDGRLSGSWPLKAQIESQCQLRAEGVRLDGVAAFGAPSLALGSVVLHGRGRGGELKFEKLAVSGGMLLANGDGNLLLANPLGQSRLNLSLTLRRGPGLPSLLGDLLGAFAPPAADGAMRLRLTGSLSAPAIGK